MKAHIRFSILYVLLAGAFLTGCNPTEPMVDIQVKPAVVEAPATDGATAALRPVAQAILGGSVDERLELIQFLSTGCTLTDGLGGPPKCLEGQEEGTLVEVFPIGGSEGSFATRETILQTLEFSVIDLYAVYAVPEDAYREAFWPAGDYALLFNRTQNEIPLPLTVLVTDGKIVRLQFHFGVPVEDILADVPVSLILIPPTQIEAWMSGGGN